ncbi:NUP57 [[Candida] subhashii]|uniref:NUP57 n=1 Tax=[Candida] subhashii TaxID=561895 RepID=A0A8J5UHZ4_9ASCO|nr:NUP57 [[Candida] subhashii]KAG7663288.1 NUP57 [[Candida] subhashii]
MFGSSANTGGGMFGSSGTQSGGLFGQKPATTGFGAQQQPQQQQQQLGTGFGSTANAPSGGGLFGQQTNTGTSTTGGGLFGNKPATGGLFGQSSQQPATGTGFGGAPAAASTGTNLFGGGASNASANTGGLFGNKPATTGTTGGGLFGSTGATGSNTSGGLFGSNPQGATPTSAPSGGLFGASSGGTGFGSAGTTGGGLFGNKPAAPSGGLFGSQQPQQQQQIQQQQQPSGGLFGNNTTNNQQPSFSWSQPQQPQSTLFNTSATGAGFGTNPNMQSSAANVNTYTPAINDQLIKISEQWDPNSPKCALKTHLYNKFNEQEIAILMSQQRPANETPEDWDNAMMKRPGIAYYPIKITSFSDIAQRIETQLDHVAKSRVLLNTINEKQNALSSKHDLENTTRILKAKARHTKLSRRLLRLATVLAILKLKGYPLLPEEEEISKQFDLLTAKLNDPNSSVGKLSDIFARLAILKERAEDLNYQFDHSINTLNGGLNVGEQTEQKVKDQAGNTDELIKKLSNVLLKQQMGLNYLNDVLEKDKESVQKLGKK